nr:reverse transcriptase domain-containing protein [Tanacetum cinerariifolium]
GATYQRLMDKAFEGQIGRNIEVYVDDLVVKSYTEAEMMRDIEETFCILRKINMKLNPKKCSFGVAEGVFLGYVEVAIGGTVFDKGRTDLCSILKKNLDIFTWQPSDMTGVPRSIAEHRLNIQEGYSLARQKNRGQAPKRAKAIQVEVQKLVEAKIMREVYYNDWLSNPVM